MIGWFQFQHGNETWTLDSVNISLSLTIKSSNENETGISWIYGVIGGIIIVITALVVFIIVQCCRKRPKKRVNDAHKKTPAGMEFQNPTYEDLDGTIRKTSESLQEKNDTMQPMQTFFQ